MTEPIAAQFRKFIRGIGVRQIRLGCGLVQGYLFSYPVDIDDAAALVSGESSGARLQAAPGA